MYWLWANRVLLVYHSFGLYITDKYTTMSSAKRLACFFSRHYHQRGYWSHRILHMCTTFHANLLISPAVTLYNSDVNGRMRRPGIPQHTLLYLFAFRIDKVAVDVTLKVSFFGIQLTWLTLQRPNHNAYSFFTGIPNRWWRWGILDVRKESRFQTDCLSCSPNWAVQ